MLMMASFKQEGTSLLSLVDLAKFQSIGSHDAHFPDDLANGRCGIIAMVVSRVHTGGLMP